MVTDYFERRLIFALEREERLDGWVKYTHGNFERYEEPETTETTTRLPTTSSLWWAGSASVGFPFRKP